jgi:phospholipid/cholesterol/gamma-HCH transport system ATP-binding protein
LDPKSSSETIPIVKDPENPYAVEVNRLTSGYSVRQILSNVSMKANYNEITAILGASGCGKTTLLKHLIRLYRPWSGRIELFGNEITTMDEPEFNAVLLNVGVLFQNAALLNSITVAENVAIPLTQHTRLPGKIIRRLVQMKLRLVNLESAAGMLPSELSGGMRKRVALARSIALDPPLLFCDEPSAGLDPVTAESLDRLILSLRDKLGMTVVIVSHAVPSILRTADHVVFMDSGRIFFSGTLHEARTAGLRQIDDFFAKGVCQE